MCDFTASRQAVRPTHSPVQWVPWALSLWVKQMEHEADHSPPSDAKVKYAWNCTSTPKYIFMAWCLIKQCLHSVVLNQAQGQLYCYIIFYWCIFQTQSSNWTLTILYYTCVQSF